MKHTLAAASLVCLVSPLGAQPFPAPRSLGPVEKYGANLQRTMSLLATSSGLQRNTVRILFYGQSITASDWTRVVTERLKRQYPLADIVAENRAIPGFPAKVLVRTAETDIFSFYPDLVILHDYGDAAPYEQMIRRIRERTTADILIATDHVAPLVDVRPEETDPAKLTAPKAGDDDPCWRSYVFLPAIAKKYGAELADVRTLWKRYLADHKLSASQLLLDDLHLNDHGDFLMAEIISAHLRYRPDIRAEDPRVLTLPIGPEEELNWKDGKLRLTFEGNKIDLICKEGASASSPAAIHIDGKKPSEFPELYLPSRAKMIQPSGKVPALLHVGSEKPLQIEEWTIHMREISPDRTRGKFRIEGSLTGPDGEGELGKRFVSKSGRVVIEPGDLHLEWPLMASANPKTDFFESRWQVVPMFADEFVRPSAINRFGDTVVTAAQGLTNGKHTLEITGSPETPIAAIRVYRPPLK